MHWSMSTFIREKNKVAQNEKQKLLHGMGFHFLYSKSMVNFEAFCWNISSSTNLSFLKSANVPTTGSTTTTATPLTAAPVPTSAITVREGDLPGLPSTALPITEEHMQQITSLPSSSLILNVTSMCQDEKIVLVDITGSIGNIAKDIRDNRLENRMLFDKLSGQSEDPQLRKTAKNVDLLSIDKKIDAIISTLSEHGGRLKSIENQLEGLL